MEPLEPSMTSEIAKELGWPRRTAYEVLSGPADDGEIRKKNTQACYRESGRMPRDIKPFLCVLVGNDSRSLPSRNQWELLFALVRSPV